MYPISYHGKDCLIRKTKSEQVVQWPCARGVVSSYWFWLGTEVDHAKVSVHIYNSDGKLAEQPDSWAKGQLAAAHIIPKTTGSYFIIVRVEESPAARTHWALAYGFR